MPEQIVEATGWVIKEKGEVVLVAEAPVPYRPALTHPDCVKH